MIKRLTPIAAILAAAAVMAAGGVALANSGSTHAPACGRRPQGRPFHPGAFGADRQRRNNDSGGENMQSGDQSASDRQNAAGQEQSGSDASHEPRSPLAIPRTELDVALLGESSRAELRDAIA
jgi:hypothetical protein